MDADKRGGNLNLGYTLEFKIDDKLCTSSLMKVVPLPSRVLIVEYCGVHTSKMARLWVGRKKKELALSTRDGTLVRKHVSRRR